MHVMETLTFPVQSFATITTSPSSMNVVKDGSPLADSASTPLVKRGRRSNPKVKTGCSTCKQRRIKCDEARPGCTQCLRSKKVCTGYPPPARGSITMTGVRIAPKPKVASRLEGATPVTVLGGIIKTTVLPPRRTKRRKRESWTTEQALVAATPSLYQPSSVLAFQQSEGSYFELFRVQTASEISGFFNSSFWGQRVLQECHSEAAIRHAVVALGALYKTLEETFYVSALPPEKRDSHMDSLWKHWQVAVKQYSEACHSVMLIDGQSLRSYRTRLMATILLTCFDSFIGDHKQAIVQMQSGLLLLEQLQSQYSDQGSPRPGDHIEDEVLIIFTRLAIQAKSYDMAFHFPQPYVIRLASQQGQSPGSSPDSSDIGSPGSPNTILIPGQFENLLDARIASDKLCEKLVRFIERLQIAMNNKSNVLPASWRQYGMDLKAQIDAWAVAFEPIFQSRFDARVSDVERAGISALKMFQINTDILFLMMFCDTEVHFDAFLPHFTAVVDLGWEVVGAQERKAAAEKRLLYTRGEQGQRQRQKTMTDTKEGFRLGGFRSSHIKPSFSADLGIVPPLYVVATKCREPRLRRQAIQLLRSSARREGMWDSELAANIAQWVMHIEEFDPQCPQTDASIVFPTRPIPEERRVMVKNVNFDLRSRVAHLRVGTRAVHEGQADDRVQTTRIVW